MSNTDRPIAPRAATESLGGTVERVTFYSEQSGFCVLRVNVRGQRELATVVGTAASVSPGEFVECEGSWVTDRSHGLQFKATQLRLVPPSTLEGIEKYLSSGMVKGIGEHFARRLVKAFGEQIFEVIEKEPDRLTTLPGIGAKRKQQVVAAWAEQRVVRDIMVFLQSHGVGTARAVRIFKTYGEDAVARVTENPYRLALDIHGTGFKTADEIAMRLGIARDAPMRAAAGVRHALQELSNDGHCATGRESLAEHTSKLLNIPTPIVETAIANEIEDDNLIVENIGTVPSVFLTPLHRAECGISNHLVRLKQGSPPWGTIDTAESLPRVEKETGLKLSASQRDAVTRIANAKVAVITGGPGVGKTTIVKSLLQIVRARDVQVLLCAPTGRAAKRLAESTGLDARTIHRVLEFDPRQMAFKRGTHNHLDTDLVVIDEVSMVDVVLMNQILRAIPEHAALLLIGDVDQLPSVGPGAVLADIIDSGRIPTVRLTEIFRQAKSSRIVVNAHRINSGAMPERPESGDELSDFYFIAAETPEAIHERLLQVVTDRIPQRFQLDPMRDIQVLTPMNRGGLGAKALNIELQKQLNGTAEPRISRFGSTFAPGDKVIQTVNNYDKEVFNGDIGHIADLEPDSGSMTIDFDGRSIDYELGELDEISLAFAATVHKSQGSEYPAVVIPIATQHYMLLERNLLYTAVTRGKKLVVIIGQPRALAIAVNTERSGRRTTNLAARLRDACKGTGDKPTIDKH